MSLYGITGMPLEDRARRILRKAKQKGQISVYRVDRRFRTHPRNQAKGELIGVYDQNAKLEDLLADLEAADA